MHRFGPAPAIAWRYLWSKKKHGAVGVITWISVVGVAVATAATICVLSVFNGFQQVLGSKLDQLSPDVEVMAARGRTFVCDDSLLTAVSQTHGVKAVCAVVEDRALAVYAGQEMPVRIKGVETDIFRSHSALDNLIVAGSDTFIPAVTEETSGVDGFSEEAILAEEMGGETTDRVVVSAGVGLRLGIPQKDAEALTLISPRREGMVNMANPAASLQMTDVEVEGVYQALQTDLDKDYVLMDIEAARELLDVAPQSVSALYVYGDSAIEPDILAGLLRAALPPTLEIRDRLMQHESQFRMSNIEKWITFLLLSFILLIASFNLISSMAMLVIDKQENLYVLHALGASRRQAAGVFAWESGFVTALGGIIGITLGVCLSLMQQHWGLIRLNGDPGTLIVQSYPAALQWGDLLAVAIPLVVIGIITALLTARFAHSRI